MYDERFIFFPPQIIDVLSSIYGEGVRSLLVWLGKKAGWDLIQDWDEYLKSRNLNDLTVNFCTILSNHGWGRFIAKQITEDLIIIELYHSISNEMDNKSRNICFFNSGILSGFGEYALYRANVIETKCCHEDAKSESCEFKIERTR